MHYRKSSDCPSRMALNEYEQELIKNAPQDRLHTKTVVWPWWSRWRRQRLRQCLIMLAIVLLFGWAVFWNRHSETTSTDAHEYKMSSYDGSGHSARFLSRNESDGAENISLEVMDEEEDDDRYVKDRDKPTVEIARLILEKWTGKASRLATELSVSYSEHPLPHVSKPFVFFHIRKGGGSSIRKILHNSAIKNRLAN